MIQNYQEARKVRTKCPQNEYNEIDHKNQVNKMLNIQTEN